MKFLLVFVGKTTDSFVKDGIEQYLKRLEHYIPTSVKVINPASSYDPLKAIKEESNAISAIFQKKDFVIVLDEKGKRFSSREFSSVLEKQLNLAVQRIVFVTGGAFGVSEELKKSAGLVLSMSDMTFTHQMIRLILSEQIYRAMTIIRNERYHHD